MKIKNKSILDYFEYNKCSKQSESSQNDVDFDINCVSNVTKNENEFLFHKQRSAMSLDEIIKADCEILNNVVQINKTLNKKHQRVDKSKSISMLKEIKLSNKDVNCSFNDTHVFPVFIKPKQLEQILNGKERLDSNVFRCNTNYRKKNWK